MPLTKLYKGLVPLHTLEKEKLAMVCPHIIKVEKEMCYYIETTNDVGQWGTLRQLEVQLHGRIGAILGDPWLKGSDLSNNTHLAPRDDDKAVYLEIGPRLNFVTAWSTNAVRVCNNAGLTTVVRLEKSRRFLIDLDCPVTKSIRDKILAILHDPMTEVEYCTPLGTFAVNYKPEPWTQVDVLGQGREALVNVNRSMGLGFDDWDLNYYTGLFQNKVKRNPTTVEIFDLAQSNSEHSRHWFFKGDYIADGEKLSQSLLDMVMATNDPRTTNQNNVIAFSDNSSGIKGWATPMLVASDPTTASRFELKLLERDLIFTAETHNFPTGVAPFSGAATGTGGRIRDVQAAGRGGHVVAGTVGYCFGNLNIPGYQLPWEINADSVYPENFATPLEVAIEASNGASDYGNKFGEPVITGFARSFGCGLGIPGLIERREWIKPIMFSGGMGTVDHDMITKLPPTKGSLILKIGGPAYRIGVGGGAASSVEVQGDNCIQRDLGAVQRGDAEMEQKMNRVIRGCLEQRPNPILSIHDQGAGGNANVLKEIMEGSGGAVYSESISTGDPTLSTLEKWGAEYQESNALLVKKDQLQKLKDLAEREQCPLDVVGVITDDQKVRLIEEKMDLDNVDVVEKPAQRNPVDLHLEHVLGNMPKKEFFWSKHRVECLPLKLPADLTVEDALERVLRLPSVASKRYLTNKVDRSVTGLVAQQQCVGPLHTPCADVAVTAHSYFDTKGTATSIGEQPIKILVDPSAGARMSVLEALTNLAAAPVTDIKDIKCSANWMWPAKLPGEGWALYEACYAMCEVMKGLGIAVDGGKDSLSMAARIKDSDGSHTVVKSPGSLVVSAYAPCPDITKVVTPDLKGPSRQAKSGLIWVRPVTAHARLGGTALAQVYSQVGKNCPDLDSHEIRAFLAAFSTIQKLINDGIVMSLHDVSDGGLITCLLEMGMSGLSGFTVDLPAPPVPLVAYEDDRPPLVSLLFSEEIGWVMEVQEQRVLEVIQLFHSREVVGTCSIGLTSTAGCTSQMKISVVGEEVISYSVLEALRIWEETSFKLECLQMNPDCAMAEFSSFSKRMHTQYKVPFTYTDISIGLDEQRLKHARVAVVREEGTNGDREMAAALIYAGLEVYDVTMTDFFAGLANLEDYRGIIFPGGFSYADVLGSGVGWAASITQRKRLYQRFESWKAQPNTFSLAVCNGCQLLAHLGWLDPDNKMSDVPSVKLTTNLSGRFESRWSRVKIESSKSILLKGMEGAMLGVWVAHGEGRFVYRKDKVSEKLEKMSCVAMRYIDDNNHPTEEYPMNPNGSKGGVASLTSPCGRHLAIMPHPERCFLLWQWPDLAAPLLKPPYTNLRSSPWSRLFQNAYDWSIN